MPLSTQIIRNGKPLALRWGSFHVAAMALAAAFDVEKLGKQENFGPGNVYDGKSAELFACYPDAAFPITRGLAFQLESYAALAATPLNEGSYTLKNRQSFIDLEDGEVLRLMPGDILYAYR